MHLLVNTVITEKVKSCVTYKTINFEEYYILRAIECNIYSVVRLQLVRNIFNKNTSKI